MPYSAIASTILSYILNQYSQGKQEQELKSLKPDESKLTLSDSDISKMKGNILGDILKKQALTQKNIKQVGSAKRLPSGAIGTQLTESDAETNRAVSRVEGDLTREKLRSQLNFQGLMNQYGQGQLNFMQNQNLSNQSYLGNLSKILMLWEGGYFNKDQQQQPQQYETRGPV